MKLMCNKHSWYVSINAPDQGGSDSVSGFLSLWLSFRASCFNIIGRDLTIVHKKKIPQWWRTEQVFKFDKYKPCKVPLHRHPSHCPSYPGKYHPCCYTENTCEIAWKCTIHACRDFGTHCSFQLVLHRLEIQCTQTSKRDFPHSHTYRFAFRNLSIHAPLQLSSSAIAGPSSLALSTSLREPFRAVFRSAGEQHPPGLQKGLRSHTFLLRLTRPFMICSSFPSANPASCC